jgi:hypothetical protein
MTTGKENGALLIAATIVAANRLRGEPITRSPKVMCAVSDSAQLARMVWQEILRGPTPEEMYPGDYRQPWSYGVSHLELID